jgi:hypothetical protein
MYLCKKCGWEVILLNWGWRDRLGHEVCVNDEPHQPVEKISR